MEKEHSLSRGKIITIIITVVLLTALAAVWFLVKDKAPEKNPTEESGITELLTADIKDIKSVKVKNSEGEATVTQKDKALTVSPENKELTQEALRYYLEGYTAVYANIRVKNAESDPSSYGIDKDNNYFEITLTDNSKHRFYIGDAINEGYYCLRAEDNTLWVVPRAVGVSLMSLPEAEKESDSVEVSIDYENIYFVGAKKAGEALFSIKRVSDSTALPYNFYSGYEITEPFSDIAYTTEFTQFLKSLGNTLTPTGHLGKAEGNSAKYGIDTGYTLTVKDSRKTHTIRFGNSGDMGTYMTYNDYPYVYLVPDSMLKVIEAADPYDFATPYIDLYMVDDVSEIIIKADGKEQILTIDNQKEKYSLSGEKIKKAEFDKIFGALTDITAYKGVEKNLVKGKKVCEITYRLKNGASYNRSYFDCQSAMVYMTQKESGVWVTVKKSAVDQGIKLRE